MTDNAAAFAELRKPFPASEIRHLPRVWCRACRDSKAGCNQHQMIKCGKCNNRISTAHIDLAYVGHAEATNRLLNVDPAWSWEPLALNERGLPQYDENGGLWIRLTVCGVTRLGYGNAEGKRGGDAVKEIIGDAIRNAGMRFGMALDLWTSSDLEIADQGPAEEPAPARDFVAEAEECATADCAIDVYRQARQAGEPADVLEAIKRIGVRLRSAETKKPAPAASSRPNAVENVELPGDEHAAAVAALRAFGAEQGMNPADIDMQAHTALGAPLNDVAPKAIWDLLSQLQTN